MENNLGREHSSIAITPDLSPENISSYINNLELIRSNAHKVDFLIIRNKSLDRDGYQKLAERIMESLNGKMPCILHFDNLDSFMGMSDLISESNGVHFTSSLLKTFVPHNESETGLFMRIDKNIAKSLFPI